MNDGDSVLKYHFVTCVIAMIRSDHNVVKVKVPPAVHPLNQDAGDSVFFVTLFL